MIHSLVLGFMVSIISIINNSIILFISLGVFFFQSSLGSLIILLYYYFTKSENDFRVIDLEDLALWYFNNPCIYLLFVFGIITIEEFGGSVIFMSIFYLLFSLYVFSLLLKSGYTERERLFRRKTRHNFLIISSGFMIFGLIFLLFAIYNTWKFGFSFLYLIDSIFFNSLGTPYIIYETTYYIKEKKRLKSLTRGI
jgi:hypothetical protein